jgi:hypothetical protein
MVFLLPRRSLARTAIDSDGLPGRALRNALPVPAIEAGHLARHIHDISPKVCMIDCFFVEFSA